MNAASPVETLVTDHLDLWTAALKRKSTAGRGSSSKVELYGIKKLRELILELAVRGLLVPQDPSDEPAGELLKKIAAEKAKLVKEGKIKKEKPLPPIRQQDEPFDLPSGWKWALLPQICSYGPGKTPSTKNSVYWEDRETGIPWVSISDMEHLRTITNTAKRITQKAVAEVFRGEPVSAGTIIMSFKLTLGKISKLGVDAYHNEAIISLRPYAGICEDYVFNFLPGRASAGNSKAAIKGNTLNSESLAALLIPLPPTAEQHRIVAKVDELMALCDQLEQQTDASLGVHQTLVETLLSALTSAADHAQFASAWQRIAGYFDTLFTTEESIDQLKQSILQLAVMGKLVPQASSDESIEKTIGLMEALPKPARYAKRSPELIQGLCGLSINNPKTPLPIGWRWTPLVEIARLESGHTPSRNRPDWWGGDIPWLGLVDARIHNNGTITETLQHTNEAGLANSAARLLPTGTVCFSRTASVGYVVKMGRPMATSQDFVNWVPTSAITSDWLKLVMITERPAIDRFSKGAVHQTIYYPAWLSMHIALPPVAEQHRIVAKVDELMALCDQLKSCLSAAQTTQLHLTDALVERAIC